MITTIISSVVAFATTNIDDIFILLVLFSQVRTEVLRKEDRAVREKAMRKKLYIAIGQYVGFSMIIFLSIVGSLSSFFIPVSWIGVLGFVPIYMGVKGLFSLRSNKSNKVIDKASSSLFKVAAITLANGADNISIYIPMFTSQSLEANIVTLIIFFCMIAIWCSISYTLLRAPILAKVLERNCHIIVPIVLIGLGMFILFRSNTIELLYL
ncbi:MULTISPECIES: cadmium resistance transporter [Bacillus cereus group]|uniref:Cadmium resistance transporter n=5 Tax=Bacillus cereus group TaxID=86661 RepID=A0AAE9PBZ8_BACCE|nr:MULTISPECIES: cadmium resistance transporter [Bacillus cereus group]EJT19698.1 Cadmium resistance transporter [Bacillus anthracis str. UR-1]AIF56851.1 quaternary ammonium transporter [Bacillus anthracis]AIK33591.1 cadmium resistance transporter family protein [Bacillus anthracis]AJG46908.1 cadmium resistance transporter family protein [Bacillus anthracis str. Turkey32]AJG67253.1 cadmium resistance transporter family protein [Bacillus anthracis]